MRFAILPFLLLTVHGVHAQDTAWRAVAGSVADSDGKPISSATVVLISVSDSAIHGAAMSDGAGYYHLTPAGRGVYYIKVTCLGYQGFLSPALRFDSASFHDYEANVRLTRRATMLQQATVVAKKPLIELKAEKMIVNVEGNSTMAGNSIFEVLRNSPGVLVDKDDNINLIGKGQATVLIDGRPTHLSPADLAALLKTMPSEGASQLEIVFNPSARYDAEGTGGVINIRLKKSTGDGLNGSVMAAAGEGNYPKFSQGITLNYRQRRLNLYGAVNTGWTRSYNQLNFDSRLTDSAGTTFTRRSNFFKPTVENGTVKIGMDYQVDAKTIIGVLVNGVGSQLTANSAGNTYFSGGGAAPDSTLAIQTTRKDKLLNTSYNLNLKRVLDSLGGEFTFDADFSTYDKNTRDHMTDVFSFLKQGLARGNLLTRDSIPNHIKIGAVKADFSRSPRTDTRIEAGLKFSRVTTDNDIQFDSLSGSTWNSDGTKTNHFLYKETIAAGYADIARDLGKWSIQVGLRAENTWSDGNSLTLGLDSKRDYLSFFPSAFVSRPIGGTSQMSLSYSRRIGRPNYETLNPFVYSIDPYTFVVGNPFLQPQYSSSFLLNYTLGSNFFASFSYTNTTHPPAETTTQDSISKVVTSTTINANRLEETGLSINYSCVPLSFWTINLYGQGTYTRYYSTVPGAAFDNKILSFNVAADNTFSLPGSYKLQARLYYISPTYNGEKRISENYTLDLGLQKPVLKKKALLKISCTDVFGWQRYQALIIDSYSRIDWTNRWESRKLMLVFLYRFGNNKVRQVRERKTGVEDETQRVKTTDK